MSKYAAVKLGNLYYEGTWKDVTNARNAHVSLVSNSLILKDCACLNSAIVAILNKIASCQYGCQGEPHFLERFYGKYCNLSNAAFLLCEMGLYDQAFSHIRSLSEITNLLALFWFSPSDREKYETLSADDRRKHFKPIKVRLRLEEVGAQSVISKDFYEDLSGLGVHPDISFSPNTHNAERTPYTRPEFQMNGCLLTFRELAFLHSLNAPIASELNYISNLDKSILAFSSDKIAHQILPEIDKLLNHSHNE